MKSSEISFKYLSVMAVLITIFLQASISAAEQSRTFAYTCNDGTRLVTEFQSDTLWLHLPKGKVKLPRVPSASGVKYEDNKMTFWAKQNEALFLQKGHQSLSCLIDAAASKWAAAKVDGVDFWAAGKRKKWELLSFKHGKGIILTRNGGVESYVFKQGRMVRASPNKQIINAKSSDHTVHIEFNDKRCQLNKEGESYPVEVNIVLDNLYKLHGCGKPL